MSDKLVTPAQTEYFRSMANAKCVSRAAFQVWLDTQAGKTLDEIKDAPPPGARIHTMPVKYIQDRLWEVAISAAGPHTPHAFPVRQIEHLYAPVGHEIVQENITLINLPLGAGNWGKALAWAKAKGLKMTNPRQVFAIGELYPNLLSWLGLDEMNVVETQGCFLGSSQNACFTWWCGSRRGADLKEVGNLINHYEWFAFCE